jgi:hypothetical protein
MDESYCAEVDEREEDEFGLSAENGDASDWVEGLHNMVQSLLREGSIVQHSPELQSFTSITEQETPAVRTPSMLIGTREIYGDLGDIGQHPGVQRVLTEIKRLQSSLNKIKLATKRIGQAYHLALPEQYYRLHDVVPIQLIEPYKARDAQLSTS